MTKDHFREEAVSKQKNTINRILYYFSWLVIVVAGILAMMTFSMLTRGQLDVYTIILFLASAGIAVYTFLIHDRILTEYEYTFTNGALDFAEVYNNRKRKSLGSLNVKNVECFGKVNSDKFQRYLNTPGVKRMNWFLNR